MSTGAEQNERDPETLALFVEESLEGLQQIDQLLLDAERGQPAADMMSTLFRAVHTIKGTAGYLAYEKTQSLAHTAEDLLSKLRDKKLAASPGHFTCLMAVGDRLRQLVDNVKQSGEEGGVEVASLVAELKAAMQADLPRSQTTAASTSQPSVGPDTPGASPPPSAQVSTAQSPAGSAPAIALPEASQKVAAPVETSPPRPNDEPAKERAQAGKVDPADGTVRVNVAVLDRLMNLIGELVLARNQLAQVAKVTGDGSFGNQAVFQRLNVVTTELQEQVMKTRMQPVARVFEKIPRMVRDVARVVGKEVNCLIEGNATEIDKALVEAIRDPVMHIVRNALDHGIETAAERKKANKPVAGTLSVRAAHKGGAVTIEIEDDGRGMEPGFIRAHAVKKGVLTATEASKLSDRESLELVFRPGFSTAAQVTDISGRGVGMDVVRTHVEQAGGQAEIESIYGRGTTIRLKMPLTLAIIPALLVRARGQRFAIPQVNLLELVYLTDEQRRSGIETVRGADIHRLRGEILPVIHLREALGMPVCDDASKKEGTYVVVLASGQRRYSLIVDAIDNTEEIVIKPLRGQLKRLTCFSGATVLGDGGVALILDVAGIASKAGIDLASQRRADVQAAASQQSTHQPAMVFTSGAMQCAVPLSVVARLEQVSPHLIERLGGQEVLQYRGGLLPILRPEAALGLTPTGKNHTDQMLLVFDFGRPVALAVDEVLDVIDVDLANVALRDQSPYTNGKTVLLGKTTLLVDVVGLLTILAPKSLQKPEFLQAQGQVLVVDASDAMRGSLVAFLQGIGLRAHGVASVDALLQEIQSSPPGKYAATILDAATLGKDADGVLRKVGLTRGEVSVFVGDDSGAQRAKSWADSGHIRGFFVKTRRDELLTLLNAVEGLKQPQ